VETFKTCATWLKTYLIIDACFSAEAAKLFLGQHVEAVKMELDTLFPQYGLTLLCSSSANSVSYILPDESATAFTDGLITALNTGSPLNVERLTLHQLAPLTYAYMLERKAGFEQIYKSRGQPIPHYMPDRPQVHTPDQRQGDLAAEPFFPNPQFSRLHQVAALSNAASETQSERQPSARPSPPPAAYAQAGVHARPGGGAAAAPRVVPGIATVRRLA
jgi:hypothetical protein